jgi:hypothetical protein
MRDKPNQEIWVVLDENGDPEYAAGWKDACHQHINDALEHGWLEAAEWVVRPFYARSTANTEVRNITTSKE